MDATPAVEAAAAANFTTRSGANGRTGVSLTSPVIRASEGGAEEIFTEDREDRKATNEIEVDQDRFYRMNRMKRVAEETHPVNPV